MERQRILVTVKTYPTLSAKYGETVCTAGVREDGSWVRLYPVPFRRLGRTEQYRKFDWIECRLARHRTDPRPESHRPIDLAEFRPVGHVDTRDEWRERRRLVIETARVYEHIDELVTAAKANERSLAVFKPARILDFLWEEDTREWDPARLHRMREIHGQYEMFADNAWRETFLAIPKLPYNFSYRIEDAAGRRSELQILDWEIGALYWNCLRAAHNDEPAALAKVRQRYFDEFCRNDLHFFLGTTERFHFVAPNPWVIVGVFPVPHVRQLQMF